MTTLTMHFRCAKIGGRLIGKIGDRQTSLIIQGRAVRRSMATGVRSDLTSEVNKAGYRRPLSYAEQTKRGVPFGKRRLDQSQTQLALQVVVGATMLAGLVLSPFLGRKLALDPPDWVPEWYNFRVPQEKGMTSREFQDMFIEMQQELHERAIKGEFHPDNMNKIDWSKEDHAGANKTPMTADDRMQRDLERKLAQRHGWDKMQPLDEEADDDAEEFEEIDIEIVTLDLDSKESEAAEATATAAAVVVDAVATAASSKSAQNEGQDDESQSKSEVYVSPVEDEAA
jgi:hypothetical protein